MAKYGVTNVAGGGGIGSDEVSVTKEYVLNGKTYVGSDTNDDIGTGTMANNGTTGNQSLNAGGSFSVKKGYHAQDFIINANGLASQTPGNAIPSHVLNGESYWTNGNKLTGTMNVQSILSFSCAPYSASQIIFTWKNPSSGPFSGVIIVGKTGGYPANVNDGTWYYKGFGNNINALGVSNAVVGGFGMNVTYYFRAFSYSVINGADTVSSTTKTASTVIQQVLQVINSSTTWNVPGNVNYIDVFCVGGGGGGGMGASSSSQTNAGGGGGGGYTATLLNLAVVPYESLNIIVGSGGTQYGGNGWGSNGGNTYVQRIGNTLCQANGGYAGRSGAFEYSGRGGDGGSGGGGGSYMGDKNSHGGDGGANGNNGTNRGADNPGSGQHSTTRAFQNNELTLYSGGGGGGGYYYASSSPIEQYPGSGGSGGGGSGGWHVYQGNPGTANTGGGGGGGSRISGGGNGPSQARLGGVGGSGVCIIRYVV